ncbi:clustered-asparagine-rich protein [Ktedonobacter racemifer DSM 44963]|uniref:Clustered-asparagine-rich protein n=1 Tax=Ktedonobacter racemifer DSM 44963 TaxID=485913 RepID=D6TL60_KTERA|nr:clustered-asparagine-rich protein [Ktedonobacter racemifer DSM 44963]
MLLHLVGGVSSMVGVMALSGVTERGFVGGIGS